jgi:hypothetical protein
MGGQPNPGTPADKRLKKNKPAPKMAPAKKAAPKMPMYPPKPKKS